MEDALVEEAKLNVFTMRFLDLECLVHSNDVPKLILVPIIGIESKDASSSGFLKDCALLL